MPNPHTIANWLQAIVGLPLLVLGLGASGLALARLERRWKLSDFAGRRATPSSPELVAELKKLQEQLSELRESTARYDLSFDTALQRIEGRVGIVEQRLSAVEGSQLVDARGMAIGER